MKCKDCGMEMPDNVVGGHYFYTDCIAYLRSRVEELEKEKAGFCMIGDIRLSGMLAVAESRARDAEAQVKELRIGLGKILGLAFNVLTNDQRWGMSAQIARETIRRVENIPLHLPVKIITSEGIPPDTIIMGNSKENTVIAKMTKPKGTDQDEPKDQQ